jgi:thioredoxin-related protein
MPAIVMAQTTVSSSKSPSPGSIQWMSIEEAMARQQVEPKLIYIEIYKEDDGWCQQMMQKTLRHKQVIAFLNEHFYAVKLNAAHKDSITFKDSVYKWLPESRIHELAAKLMKHKISYPYRVFYTEKKSEPMPLPGYVDVKQLELILKYLVDTKTKKMNFDTYKKSFTSTW